MRRELGDGYELDDDPARIDLEAVHAYLGGESYWAEGRSREVQDALDRRAPRASSASTTTASRSASRGRSRTGTRSRISPTCTSSTSTADAGSASSSCASRSTGAARTARSGSCTRATRTTSTASSASSSPATAPSSAGMAEPARAMRCTHLMRLAAIALPLVLLCAATAWATGDATPTVELRPDHRPAGGSSPGRPTRVVLGVVARCRPPTFRRPSRRAVGRNGGLLEQVGPSSSKANSPPVGRERPAPVAEPGRDQVGATATAATYGSRRVRPRRISAAGTRTRAVSLCAPLGLCAADVPSRRPERNGALRRRQALRIALTRVCAAIVYSEARRTGGTAVSSSGPEPDTGAGRGARPRCTSRASIPPIGRLVPEGRRRRRSSSRSVVPNQDGAGVIDGVGERRAAKRASVSGSGSGRLRGSVRTAPLRSS